MVKVKLRKPLVVGDGAAAKTIDEIDLTGLDALTGADVLFCRREAFEKTGRPVVYGPLDDNYRMEIVAKVSGVAAELLPKLSFRDFEAVDRVVKGFLLDADSDEPTPSTPTSAPPA